MKNKKKPKDIIKETEDYIVFLKKRLDSANYKANVYDKTKKNTISKVKINYLKLL